MGLETRYVARVGVRSKDGWLYECQAIGDGFWRCGKCGRGVLESEVGCKCRVCSSEAAFVYLDWDRIRRQEEQIREWKWRVRMLEEQFEREVQKMDIEENR